MLEIEDINNVVVIWQKPEEPDGEFMITMVVDRDEHNQYLIETIVADGMPYKVIPKSNLPNNIFYEMEFYSYDFSEPDGYGSGSYTNKNGVEVVGSFTGSYEQWKEVHNV